MALNERGKGIILALLGGSFWGGSGVAGQYLLQDCGFATDWLVTSRMVLAGLILLAIDAVKNKGDIFGVWKNRLDVKELLLFSFAGMLVVQYSYFACIAYGNAAAATVLQYLMPAFIVLYTIVKLRKLPPLVEIFCVCLAISGTFLLVTHGEWGKFTIPLLALLWGLISGISGAVYTMTPKRLIRKWRATLIVGWGMLLGGIALAFITSPWSAAGVWNATSMAVFAYVILFGSVLAFWFYLGSTKYIQPAEAGVLASVEPVTAIILSALLLGQSFELMDIAGSLCILVTVFILSRR